MNRTKGILFGCILGAAAVGAIWYGLAQPSLPPAIQAELDWANRQTHQAAAEALDPIGQLFAKAKKGTSEFAEEVLSFFGGKWQYLWSSEEEFRKYLQQQFAKKVLHPDEVKRAVEQAFKLYLKKCEEIDSDLFVRIRADVPDLENRPLDSQRFMNLVQQATVKALRSSGDEIWTSLLRDTVAGNVAVLIGEEIITQIIIIVTRRVGLTVAATAASWETLGISILVGFVLDWVWDWWTDPEGKLSEQLNQQLDQLHRELRQELSKRMDQMSQARHVARIRVVEKALARKPVNPSARFLPESPEARRRAGAICPAAFSASRFEPRLVLPGIGPLPERSPSRGDFAQKNHTAA